ncbi:hypothetical protein THAOC_25000 [Thalassiosira oceanica]|uniref:Uncharacterized protein n=1 Tax=Thalassiosira oceanica TaxID=159749 RepID=K0S969_THAOC|nr:hypothetical protein THAOC_25000 [Thalassiosira oceanica]|eukprot:EJK55282.1 hypothetical protein THAOC_25000 [Thalassiosira oceanica]
MPVLLPSPPGGQDVLVCRGFGAITGGSLLGPRRLGLSPERNRLVMMGQRMATLPSACDIVGNFSKDQVAPALPPHDEVSHPRLVHPPWAELSRSGGTSAPSTRSWLPRAPHAINEFLLDGDWQHQVSA